jgi:hypothetical protein
MVDKTRALPIDAEAENEGALRERKDSGDEADGPNADAPRLADRPGQGQRVEITRAREITVQ